MQEKAAKKVNGFSGESWWRKVIKTANIIVSVGEVVVAAPLKLPLKMLLAVCDCKPCKSGRKGGAVG
jgi:uncharacterized protein (UPF0218 family)